MGKKWNYETKEYEKYDLPKGSTLMADVLDKIVNCADCGKKMKYGDGYISREIHGPLGFGCMVCNTCYYGAWEKQKGE